MMRQVLRLGLAALAMSLMVPASSGAASFDPIGSFSAPVFVTSDPTDPDRLFVVEQGGRIQLVEGGAQSTYLDLNAPTDFVASGGERGLLSMALAPDFATSGHFFVYYTRQGATGPELGDIQIDRFTAGAGADTVAQNTRRAILTIEHTTNSNHNGGQLQFGPDGHLYAATGDGGGAGDPFDAGQDLNSLLGKLLRIDPTETGTPAYTVPADNPFVGVAGADEIWSYGLRNPWRFSFDSLTGDLVIADVGQGKREEIDYDPAPGGGRGDNYGWDCREGTLVYDGDPLSPDPDSPSPLCAGGSGFVAPAYEYSHANGNCSITGGYVVRDVSLGALVGRYVYADFCVGQVRSIVLSAADPSATTAPVGGLSTGLTTSFGEDSCGRIYVARSAAPPADNVLRITGNAPADCDPDPEQRTLTVTVGGDGSVTGDGIDCPGDCSETFDDGASLTLTAEPDTDVTFSGWSGHCSGTGTCDLVMSADRAVAATFTDHPPPVLCAGLEATIVAEAGIPVTGTAAGDVIAGSAGEDEISGGGGADLVCAGEGDDDVAGGPGADQLKGNDGADQLGGGDGRDRLGGGPGPDRCHGGRGGDRFSSC